jgi:hypothetical protein
MEDDLNSLKMEDNLIFYENGKLPNFTKIKNDLNILVRRLPNTCNAWPTNTHKKNYNKKNHINLNLAWHNSKLT